MPRFYHYRQNNSGGEFAGPAINVVVEARTRDEADSRLESVGGYFNGVEDGLDCSCCGDRWSQCYDNGDSEPMVYDMPIGSAALRKEVARYARESIPYAMVLYLDGSKVFVTNEEDYEDA